MFAFTYQPYVYYDAAASPKWSGYLPDKIEMVAAELGFTYDMVEIYYPDVTLADSDGTYVGWDPAKSGVLQGRSEADSVTIVPEMLTLLSSCLAGRMDMEPVVEGVDLPSHNLVRLMGDEQVTRADVIMRPRTHAVTHARTHAGHPHAPHRANEPLGAQLQDQVTAVRLHAL